MKIKLSTSPLLILTGWGKILNRYFSEFSNSALSLKNYFFLLFIFPFFISDSIAQNFFPLKVGNAYQIKNDWWWVGSGGTGESGTDYYYLKVVDDTVINGQLFFSLLSNYEYPPFKPGHLLRYDSLQQKLILTASNDTTNRLAVDFNAPVDSHYISYITGSPIDFISRGISYQIVMGDTQLVYLMEDIELPRNSYNFATEIGLTQYKSYQAYFPPGYAYSETHNTISPIIDSFIYNLIVLGVDSMYPTNDRPVDTFPYLLTISYTASYSALIDSFHLDVQHLRVDTLVQTKKYNISTSNPQISFNLNGLLSGDKIKLRVTVTDTSIFYNVAHYPDTGWVVMNVLPPILNVESGNLPIDYELAQNFPNPFNPATKIRYELPERSFITISVYDVLGKEIATLVNEEKLSGSYEVEFNGNGLASGIYYYRIIAGEFSQTRKMILLK